MEYLRAIACRSCTALAKGLKTKTYASPLWSRKERINPDGCLRFVERVKGMFGWNAESTWRLARRTTASQGPLAQTFSSL